MASKNRETEIALQKLAYTEKQAAEADVYDVLEDMMEYIVWISLGGDHVFDATRNLPLCWNELMGEAKLSAEYEWA